MTTKGTGTRLRVTETDKAWPHHVYSLQPGDITNGYQSTSYATQNFKNRSKKFPIM